MVTKVAEVTRVRKVTMVTRYLCAGDGGMGIPSSPAAGQSYMQ